MKILIAAFASGLITFTVTWLSLHARSNDTNLPGALQELDTKLKRIEERLDKLEHSSAPRARPIPPAGLIAPPKSTSTSATKATALENTSKPISPTAPSANPDAPRPKIVFETLARDLGTILPSTTSKTSYEFRNEGPGILHIGALKSDCGCTAALLSNGKSDYQPGEAGIVEVTYRASFTDGDKKQHVTVPTDDPDHTQVTLTVSAHIQSYFDASPASLNFGDVVRNTQPQRTVRLCRHDGQAIHIASAKATVPEFDVKIEAPQGDGLSQTLTVTARPSLPTRFVHGYLVVSSGGTEVETRLPISMQVQGKIQIHPSRLYVSMSRKAESATHDITLVASDDVHFKIVDANIVSGAFKTGSISTVREGHEYRIPVTFAPAADLKNVTFPGELLIKTDFPEEPEIHIQLTGWVYGSDTVSSNGPGHDSN